MSYLKRFPINTLKLDKSFVDDIPENAKMATIVRAVIQMGDARQCGMFLSQSEPPWRSFAT